MSNPTRVPEIDVRQIPADRLARLDITL